MREARQAACEQLDVPLHQCALVAIRPGEPLWNREALEQAIIQVLPEAQQKRLERGLGKDGWFRTSKDIVLTAPNLIDTFKSFAGRMLSRTWRSP
ncbi:hypothetical protein [Allochromatium tepidum]|nr:hypothetical protein [Allochromatium tepidum]BCU06032.1 hypothetical protein Atep_07090 [Allochromatium tepidum]